MLATQLLEMSGTAVKLTEHFNPEDLNLQQPNLCEDV
jgi:hypothetical protein